MLQGTDTPLRLSVRQREVLGLLAEGIPAREIAVRLGLAETTVRNHIRCLLRKLGCHSQLEAVAKAYRLGLLDHPEAPRAAVALPEYDSGGPAPASLPPAPDQSWSKGGSKHTP